MFLLLVLSFGVSSIAGTAFFIAYSLREQLGLEWTVVVVPQIVIYDGKRQG
jgi:hypothetical protein